MPPDNDPQRTVTHPSVIVCEYAIDEAGPLYTMELLPGCDLYDPPQTDGVQRLENFSDWGRERSPIQLDLYNGNWALPDKDTIKRSFTPDHDPGGGHGGQDEDRTPLLWKLLVEDYP